MSQVGPIQQVNPARPCKQVTLTSTAASLESLLGGSAPYANNGGIQLKGLSGNGTSAFWNTTAATCLANVGDEIPAGTAQVVSPNQSHDTAGIFLVGASGGEVVAVNFLGG
jgi:hypothetical protein